MKKLIIMFACALQVWAGEPVIVEVSPIVKTFQDNETLESNPGVRIQVEWKDFYIFAQGFNNLAPTYYQQQLASVDLRSIGVGFSDRLTDNLKFFLGISYNMPSVELMETTREALTYYINERVGNQPRHDYNYTIKSEVGSEIGIKYSRALSERWSLGMAMSYEHLTLPTRISAYDDATNALNEFNIDSNYSGFVFGANLKFIF